MALRPSCNSPVPGEYVRSLLPERLWVSETAPLREGSVLSRPSLKERQQLSLLLGSQPFFPGLQDLAALVPGVSQVDNKSDFLGKRPHRRHPGILQLPRVRLPQALADTAQLLLLRE